MLLFMAAFFLVSLRLAYFALFDSWSGRGQGAAAFVPARADIVDRNGVPLERRGNPGEDRDFERAGLWTGTIWSEREAGTNGIGTCIVEGRAVTIHRDQHFLTAHTGLSCTSAPIHDAEGRLTAVLDVSSASTACATRTSSSLTCSARPTNT